ncbi:uncharacterized protein LOC142163483 [Nicotiana tabacum]|uniref:Uncharacterized protein LOC142163483 n=1 Tax=Nicotiana tabacum TaxID=4097 RepID=A0AC58RVX4_TOBAC
MVGILIIRDLRVLVVKVRRVKDKLMAIKLVVGGEDHLVTFQSSLAKTQIDYLLLQKCDRSLCMDCKVIPSENLTTQHRLLVMDLEIVRKRKKWDMYGQPRIRWCALTYDKAQELGQKALAMGAWRISGDASCMWTTTIECIRLATRELLGVSKGFSGGHKGDW